MYKRAIICTDLTPSSSSVVACAGALGGLGVREAILVHVLDVETPPTSADLQAADALLQAQARLLEAASIDVTVDTSLGYPAFEIDRLADEHRADLIVIGSHRKGMFATTLSGSVSSDVARMSTRPVLLAVLAALGSPETSAEVCGRLLGHVLFATDLTPASEVAADHVLGLATRRPGGVQAIDILHVIEPAPGNGLDRRNRAYLARLDELVTAFQARGSRVAAEVVAGDPARETASRAARGAHTLVVLAPRFESAGDEPLGSVTHAVVRATAAPLLLIPPRCRRPSP